MTEVPGSRKPTIAGEITNGRVAGAGSFVAQNLCTNPGVAEQPFVAAATRRKMFLAAWLDRDCALDNQAWHSEKRWQAAGKPPD